MKLFIKQHIITFFGRRYIVYQDERRVFSIRRSWMNPFPKYAIKEYPSKKRIGKIRNRFLSLRGNAVITLPSGTYKFDQEKIFSMSYDCERLDERSDRYHLVGHEGLSGSIFKNDVQIGEWDKNAMVFLNGDVYEIDLDFDADILLISAIMVLIDTYRISILVPAPPFGWESGNIGDGLLERRPDWTPKEKADKGI